MSGITPLIDTLLHQVLGRQGEVSSQRVLNAPVQPVLPGEGPRALQGDAGLDGRPHQPQHRHTSALLLARLRMYYCVSRHLQR